jgi:hypothetical protein
VAKGGAFNVLADQTRFEAVQIGERGRTLIWHDDAGDEIDLCADALWQMAHGKVSAAWARPRSAGTSDPKAATDIELAHPAAQLTPSARA